MGEFCFCFKPRLIQHLSKSFSCRSLQELVVSTKQGKLAGEWMQTSPYRVIYASFRGIPYAQPPVGSLRFKVNERIIPT